jgi:hypothetical protein
MKVNAPTDAEIDKLASGTTLISLLSPALRPELLEALAKRGVTALALDAVPRISRAQSMDVLSSMANLAGYRAVIESAHEFGRLFTGQVTAAGKVPPAKVLVAGAGVAGLAAIGAASSLGAIVRATDPRPEVADQVRSIGGEYVAVMLDTKGPEIRMGGLKVCKETGNRKAKMKLTTGQTLTLTNDKAFDGAGDERTIYVDYPRLAEVVEPGTTVLLDDGLISLEVVSAADGKVTTTVLNSSEIGERKGVNIPGVVTGLPAMSDKDLEDISFGIEHDIDMVAASFVRNAAGVHQIREHILKCHEKYAANGGMDTPPPMIISKIESTEALDNLAEIIEASDGIMVARGDLGVEVPLEKVTWEPNPKHGA